MRALPSLSSLALTAFVAAFAPVAQALEVHCVSTVSQLANAVEQHEDQEMEIRIVAGTCDVPGICLTRDVPACIPEAEPMVLFPMTIKGATHRGVARARLTQPSPC